MEFKKFSNYGLSFTILFALFGIFAQFIPLSQIIGYERNFTLFELITPIPVAFLGLWAGLAAICISKLGAILALGAPLDFMSIARLLPPLAAGVFFYEYKKSGSVAKSAQIALPLLAMAAFCLHPAIFGTFAMAYSLYWLIPMFAAFLPNLLFLRSLGATFCQHAIGSIIFLYTIPALQNPQVWIALIPIVAVERLFFASGIMFSCLAVNYAHEKFGILLKATGILPSASPLPQKKKGSL